MADTYEGHDPVPPGYTRLPGGVRCRCLRCHVDQYGAAWCCNAGHADERPGQPIPMMLWCPKCNAKHVDKGEFATKPHHSHQCHACGLIWRPAIPNTVGVERLFPETD